MGAAALLPLAQLRSLAAGRLRRAGPALGEGRRRPSADEIEAAVALCPSGALRTRRPGQAKRRALGLDIRASENGPLLIRGDVRVPDAEGNVLYEGDKAALCRCGGSANKPFCDGTHARNGFRG